MQDIGNTPNIAGKIHLCLTRAAYHLDEAEAGHSLMEGDVEPGTGTLRNGADDKSVRRLVAAGQLQIALAQAYTALAATYQAAPPEPS